MNGLLAKLAAENSYSSFVTDVKNTLFEALGKVLIKKLNFAKVIVTAFAAYLEVKGNRVTIPPLQSKTKSFPHLL